MNMPVLIPQFFYDLIGRVAPGAFLICWLATPFAFFWPEYDAAKTIIVDRVLGHSLLRYVLAFGLAYFVGSILGSIWKVVDYISKAQFEHRHFSKAFNAAFETIQTEPELTKVPKPSIDLVGYMYDAIRLTYPKAGARIAKLRAEQYQAGALFIGFIFSGLVFLCAGIFKVLPARPMLILVPASFLLATTSYLFLTYISSRIGYGIASLWVLLKNNVEEK